MNATRQREFWRVRDTWSRTLGRTVWCEHQHRSREAAEKCARNLGLSATAEDGVSEVDIAVGRGIVVPGNPPMMIGG